MNWQAIVLVTMGLMLTVHDAWADKDREEKMRTARKRMVQEIEVDVMETSRYIGRGQLSAEVMRVMEEVPRHEFVPSYEQGAAYLNRPLPIGYGQTISQPYIVALMTDLLAVSKEGKILEVGAGSGYQAAVLSRLVNEVHSIEIIPELAKECRERLARLGYANVTIHQGDGYYGLQSEAPFDAIVVTAAATSIPPPLVQQLKPGGRLVIPVGTPFAVQHLMLVEKNEQGEIAMRQVLPVQFVPLTGKRE
ncbi:protein-L-isoaspartate O-methyltransferase [Desulfobulbus propionicus DSM 2032]|uniref:Protein-L-isoaspartate O-methyltransferase n=1 Tax=Desulfobulbus propionicus (strain ATCC 33891 / DSM 2032 / VKM B-1956 / 1pr3) TaxID=577650 RepID=A0A7U3YLA9_DESPD|nr:protein-L-isoaspartate(D-aspartate) O-methyltransferase [Desulfobulbus propionicus]ADW17496.1 protein-L-isoaspartate O-methyltransferase [Desulfobulbus propionicus DSM 2032]